MPRLDCIGIGDRVLQDVYQRQWPSFLEESWAWVQQLALRSVDPWPKQLVLHSLYYHCMAKEMSKSKNSSLTMAAPVRRSRIRNHRYHVQRRTGRVPACAGAWESRHIDDMRRRKVHLDTTRIQYRLSSFGESVCPQQDTSSCAVGEKNEEPRAAARLSHRCKHCKHRCLCARSAGERAQSA